MIKINGLNKYFNKGKSSQNHVINNTTLEFGDTGLVCILGESGSGKTTLLNTLGGLDSYQKGSITIGETTLDRYSPSHMEELRNAKFGYVFQQRYLLQDHTVAYNIGLGLNMYQMSEEEKEARIEYVLQAVGMNKFRKRLVSQLSGGQQQRIAIARALVKTPEVIFADEPTGSLDEINTMRIMNILKKISKECLVILVTHEKRIAEFFADRIILIQDGKVTRDQINEGSGTYQFSDTANLYLGEFKKENYDTDGANINYYHSGKKDKITLNIVYHNEKFYLRIPDESKVAYLSAESEMQMIDDVRPVIDMDQVEEFDYSLPRLEATKKSSLSFQQIYKMAKENMKMMGKRQAFMIVAFLITAALLVIATVDYLTTISIDKEDFITEDSHYINVLAEQNTSHEWDNYRRSYNEIYNGFIKSKIADDLYIDLHKELAFSCVNIEQFQKIAFNFTNTAFVTIEHLNKGDLVSGRMPKNRNEIVIDQWLINQFYRSDSIMKEFMPDAENFLNLKLTTYKDDIPMTIVGICDTGEPTIYIDKYRGISLSYRNKSVGSLQQLQAAYPGKYDDITLAEDEVLVSEALFTSATDWNSDITIDTEQEAYLYDSPNGNQYKVVGTYPNDFQVDSIIDDNYYKEYLSIYLIKLKKFNIYSDEREMKPILDYFYKNKGNFDWTYVKLTVLDTYQDELEAFKVQRANYLNARLVVTVAIFALSMLMLFFTMKSNAIRRIQEIAVYRLMGITKRSILSAFLLEVVMITNYTVLPVVLVLSVIVKFITSIPSLKLGIVYPWPAAILILVFLYAVNIIVCTLSVIRLIRMPPAQMTEKM